jgi:hypothetical protein
MIDPKRIELSSYDGIPHLITPVVTDIKKATNAVSFLKRLKLGRIIDSLLCYIASDKIYYVNLMMFHNCRSKGNSKKPLSAIVMSTKPHDIFLTSHANTAQYKYLHEASC